MGYFVKSKKINILLDEHQQREIFNIWMHPSEDLQKNNWSLRVLPSVFKEAKCSNLKEILDMLGFAYEEKKNKLKLKNHEAKFQHQRNFFDAVAHAITPGNFMTLRGEDGAFIGWFFNGKEIIDYSSYEQLKELQKPFELKQSLEKELSSDKINNNKKKIKL